MALREDLRDLADEQSRRARTDALTGLGNRTRWAEAETEAQRRVDEEACPVAVITIDVDGLKEINDTYGHDVGDALLRRCADILRQHVRGDDVLCRVGGDEFAMLLPIGPGPAADRAAALIDDFAAVRSRRRDADAAMYAHKKARRAGRVAKDA